MPRCTGLVLPGKVLIATAVVAFSSVSPALADECTETNGALPATNAKGLAELEPAPKRPTLTVPLDSGSSATDEVTLPTKKSQRIGRTPGSASAVLLERLRQDSRPLKATVRVAARPTRTGSGVVVTTCLSNKDDFEAGTFEGTVQVYGPKLKEFTYPVITTSKWPFWVPLILIVLVIIVYLGFAWKSDAPLDRKGPGSTTGNLIYGVVAAGAAALTYWSSYVEVDTWGDKPGVQIAALVVSALTAAVAGHAAAAKALK